MKIVEVVNLTKKSKVLSKVTFADNFFTRLKGLLGVKQLGEDAGLIIKPCNSVHTFFMKFLIDIAFVDRNRKVCYIIHTMKTNKISPVVKNTSFVIEAPAGTFKRKCLEVGDEIEVR